MVVENLYVFKNIGFGFYPGIIKSFPNPFTFQIPEKAHYNCINPTITFSAWSLATRFVLICSGNSSLDIVSPDLNELSAQRPNPL